MRNINAALLLNLDTSPIVFIARNRTFVGPNDKDKVRIKDGP
jgi:hypothetical protein